MYITRTEPWPAALKLKKHKNKCKPYLLLVIELKAHSVGKPCFILASLCFSQLWHIKIDPYIMIYGAAPDNLLVN